MGNPVTVPIFDPQGTLRDVPFDQLKAATASGGTIAHPVKAPDGTTRMVPVNRLDEAVKNGGTILPMDENFAPQHPGWWQELYGDVAGLAKNVPLAAARMLQPAGPQLYGTGATGGGAEAAQQQMEQTAQNYDQRKAAGNTLPYRLSAAAAETQGVNVTGMEKSATEGDIGGVLGHAAAVPVAMAATHGVAKAAPLVSEALSDVAQGAASAIKPGLSKLGSTATAVGQSLDPDIVGLVSPRAAHALRLANKIGKVATKLSASPETDATADITAAAPVQPDLGKELGSLRQTGATPASQTGQALSSLRKNAAEPKPYVETAPEGTPSQTATDTGEPMPPSERTLSGDSALRKILTGQDNSNLLKIAKSRGISVTQEAQLKPGVADNRLISKIVDDFSPDELDEIGARYLESNRFRHDFQDIGPEAWKTLSLQTYFPDLKLSQALVNRTHAAILKGAANRLETAAPATSDDLTGILQDSLKQAQSKKGPQAVQ